MKEKIYMIVDSKGKPMKNSQGRLRLYRSLEQLKDYSYLFEEEYVKVYELKETIRVKELENRQIW